MTVMVVKLLTSRVAFEGKKNKASLKIIVSEEKYLTMPSLSSL